jgi:hypothetical protein
VVWRARRSGDAGAVIVTPEDRAAGESPVDLDHWSEILPDDDDLVSSDLAAAAMGVCYAVLFAAAVIGVAVVFW